MNQQPDDVIQRYLLGLLDEAECEEVELSYLADSSEDERLGAAEDELIEDYLDGLLSAEENRGFEHHFLNAAERQEKLDFARRLRAVVQYATAEVRREAVQKRINWFRAPSVAWMRWVPATTIAVAVLCCGFLVLQNRKLSKTASLSRNDNAVLIEQNDKLRRDLHASPALSYHSPGSSSAQLVVEAFLSPGMTRSGTAPSHVSIPPQAQLTKFRLELFTADYSSYRAVVRTAEGQELLSQSNLRPSSRHELILLVPADLLDSSNYQILLAGKVSRGNYEPAASYFFQVVR